MKHVLTITSLCALTGTVLAGPQAASLRQVRGIHYASADLSTGAVSPTQQQQRIGDSIWAATELSGYYWTQMNEFGGAGQGVLGLDWGDVASDIVGGYAFAYATDILLPARIECINVFYADDNGFNSASRTALAAFQITQLPTADPGGSFNTWIITLDLEAAGAGFPLDGSDLDGDGLADFSYTFWFPGAEGTATGPVIAGDPNVQGQGAGMEDAFDVFGADPNDPNGDSVYIGTYWFGGDPFAQFYMELFDEYNDPGDCWKPGASGKYCSADIDGTGDCMVNLADLAVLLSNYGTTSGATHDQGDLEGGDGDVDLADLAEMLSQYGDDCN